MAGDKIDVFGKSYYFNSFNPNDNSPLELIDILNAFLGGPAALGTSHGITGASINNPINLPGINSMITQQETQSAASNKPRAFINVIFFDEQFKSYEGGFRISMVGSSNVLKDHYSELQNIVASKSGYVYIYCSNESPVNVFFDNLQVVHTRGALLEETHYYPFGLTMAGISSKAVGSLENKRKWNVGSELNSDFDINLYETFYRSLDPQIGRFWQIDPKPTEYESPYVSMGDNPISNVDPRGDYFFGLFGSTSEQRKAARAFAEATGGEIHNITSKNVSVKFTVTVDATTNNIAVGNTHFYSDGFAKVYGKEAHKEFVYQSNGLKYGWGRINPETGAFERIPMSGRVDMVDDPITMLGPGLIRGLFLKLASATAATLAATTTEKIVGTESKWVLGAFKSEAKWVNQLAKRGWTPEQITEAVTKGEKIAAENLVNPLNGATRYINPTTGQSVVLDNVTKEVLHVGAPGFKY